MGECPAAYAIIPAERDATRSRSRTFPCNVQALASISQPQALMFSALPSAVLQPLCCPMTHRADTNKSNLICVPLQDTAVACSVCPLPSDCSLRMFHNLACVGFCCMGRHLGADLVLGRAGSATPEVCPCVISAKINL